MAVLKNPYWLDPKIALYYRALERVTRPAASLLLLQSGILSFIGPLKVFDNACGTGAISSALYEQLSEKKREQLTLTCGDVTTGMVRYMAELIEENRWRGVEARVVDAQDTGLNSDCYTHVFTGFGWQTIAKSLQALAETYRVLQPGGTSSCSNWEHFAWYDLVRATTATIPTAPPYPDREAIHAGLSDGLWHSADFTQSALEKVGFVDVQVERKMIPMKYSSVEEFMDAGFLTMMQMLLRNLWSKEDYGRLEGQLEEALEKYMVGKYGRGTPFEFECWAILASGRKPLV